MTKQEMICIICPMSCHLEVELDENHQVKTVSGNSCPRGDIYARKELTAPTRMVTSTVKIKHALYSRLPVITSSDIPKQRMFDLMALIAEVELEAPIRVNDVIIENALGLGVDVIASRSMERI